jgi:hypothetical protein
MTAPERYRKLAAEFRARARYETNTRLQAEWTSLAEAYLRLAQQAEHNSRSDVSYEPAWTSKFGDLGGEPA